MYLITFHHLLSLCRFCHHILVQVETNLPHLQTSKISTATLGDSGAQSCDSRNSCSVKLYIRKIQYKQCLHPVSAGFLQCKHIVALSAAVCLVGSILTCLYSYCTALRHQRPAVRGPETERSETELTTHPGIDHSSVQCNHQ